MGVLTYILGRSGTGKSYSLRNFKPDEVAIINVQGKILPFKGSSKYHLVNTDDSTKIMAEIKTAAKTYKSIVIDDFQYVMANEFMRRSMERGYDKFTEIGAHAWGIADMVRELPADVIVYIMCHTDTDQEGFERLKTIGKLLDDKIVLEGMSTIVLKTAVSDGKYTFVTQNNGKDTVKSPAGMFPSYAIDNDLKYVDDKIRNYYELGNFKSDEEMKAADEAVKTDLAPTEEKKRGRRSRNKAVEEARSEFMEKQEELNKDIPEEGINYEDYKQPEVELPKRKKRGESESESENKTVDNVDKSVENPTTEAEGEVEEEKPRRRRRRVKED